MNEIGKTSGVGFEKVGASALDSGKGLTMNDALALKGSINDPLSKTLDAIVDTKIMKSDFQNNSLAALSVIKTGEYNELFQKDSPLSLANQVVRGVNINILSKGG